MYFDQVALGTGNERESDTVVFVNKANRLKLRISCQFWLVLERLNSSYSLPESQEVISIAFFFQ